MNTRNKLATLAALAVATFAGSALADNGGGGTYFDQLERSRIASEPADTAKMSKTMPADTIQRSDTRAAGGAKDAPMNAQPATGARTSVSDQVRELFSNLDRKV